MKMLLSITVLLAGYAACAQCPATALPYTDSFSDAAVGVLNSCWTPVVGPAGSIAAAQLNGVVLPSVARGYAVEMFTAAAAANAISIQASIVFVSGNYSAICMDQNATGAAVCLIPSAGAIFKMVANSGASPGGPLCNWSTAATAPKSGDIFSITRVGGVYQAVDVTKGETLCSIAFTEPSGSPSIQVDNRGGSGDSIGPVTVSGPPVIAPPLTPASYSEPGIQIDVPTAPATAYTITLTNFNFIPGIDPGSWAFSCSAPVAAAAPSPPAN